MNIQRSTHNRFSTRYGTKPTYKCRACDHNTRETGYDESSCQLCAFCFELCSDENSYSDGAIELPELVAAAQQLVARFKPSEERIRKSVDHPELLAALFPA